MIRFIPAVLAVVAAAYCAQAYLPVGVSYYRVREATRSFAQAAATSEPTARAVQSFVAAVRSAGVEVAPEDLRLRRLGPALSTVQLRFGVPLQFPLVGRGRVMHFAIAADPRGEVE
jgi:hypothetical protein